MKIFLKYYFIVIMLVIAVLGLLDALGVYIFK
jgi:hypothetical protein